MSITPTRGDRPRIGHAPRPRRRPRYTSAADWPSWTDEEVVSAEVHPAEWPDHVARVRFAVPPSLDTLRAFILRADGGGGPS